MPDETNGRKSVPDIPINDLGTSDEDAAKELASFRSEELEKEARSYQHRRRESIRDTLHKGAKLLIWIAIVILTTMVLFWAYHLLAPEHLHFLSTDQYNELKSVLFSAALSAFVSGYAKQML